MIGPLPLPCRVGSTSTRRSSTGRYPWGGYSSRKSALPCGPACLAGATRFADGIAAVAGLDEDPQCADRGQFVSMHLAEPTTFKGVMAWERLRGADLRDAPGRRER